GPYLERFPAHRGESVRGPPAERVDPSILADVSEQFPCRGIPDPEAVAPSRGQHLPVPTPGQRDRLGRETVQHCYHLPTGRIKQPDETVLADRGNHSTWPPGQVVASETAGNCTDLPASRCVP